jgi:3-hydroxyisobutyrate dehydrogenase
MIAWLGTGLLGANFVRALRRRGHEVRVWNRTAERARALVADGATAHEDVADAVRGAARVHLTLADDASVDEVLERARPGLASDVVIVDHTTTSPSGTRARAARWQERGIAFQHAPVFMAPANALQSSGVMLASGDRPRFEALAPELRTMTGNLVYVGPEVDRAASFKLLGNLFLMFLTTGLADMFALAKALGISAEQAMTLFDAFNPAQTIGARAKRMMDKDFAHPSWELAMARKDARLMLEEAASAGVPLAIIPAIAAEMDRWVARGHAHDDWTVMAKDAV